MKSEFHPHRALALPPLPALREGNEVGLGAGPRGVYLISFFMKAELSVSQGKVKNGERRTPNLLSPGADASSSP
jgi:hypothetical protein